jgi:tetratricopeptide (TPR) repeat protein
MIRKISFIVTLMILISGIVSAQTAQDGLALLNQKDFNGAKKIFASLLKSDPKNAAAYYGMGEYYFYTGKADSAKVFYQEGIDANSSYAYNYAGLGKVSASTDPTAAADYFKNAIKKAKKDAGPVVAIAKYYYELNPRNLVEARKYTDQAIAIDGKSAAAYFLDGQIDIAENKASDAALNFDRAIFFDPKNLDAYVYASQIMATTRNLNKATEYLNNALAVNPKYWKAYKALGELYYDNGKYAESVNNFAIYFKNVPQDEDVTHYAYSLFFNKQFDEANNLLQGLLKKNPNDYVLLRLLAYISYETKDYQNGRAVMERYFTLVPQDKILDEDYAYYGKMLSATGQDSLAIQYYNRALDKDSSKIQLYDDIARSYRQLKQFDQALAYNTKYVDKKPNKTTVDYFNLAKSYYSIASGLKPDSIPSDSIKQKEYYMMADSLFGQVEVYSPTSYLGSFWRARVNSQIDKETTLGLAKPYYEKALEMLIKDPAKYKKEISEIYSYLAFYYYVKEDNATSIDFWKKVLELDPENQKAQGAISALEKKKN